MNYLLIIIIFLGFGCGKKAAQNPISIIEKPVDGPPGVPGAPGEPGQDGQDGKDGNPGPQGPAGPPGRDGADGKDGADGRDGTDGRDGRDGKDGRVIRDPYIFNVQCTDWRTGQKVFGPVRATRLNYNHKFHYFVHLHPSTTILMVKGHCIAYDDDGNKLPPPR